MVVLPETNRRASHWLDSSYTAASFFLATIQRCDVLKTFHLKSHRNIKNCKQSKCCHCEARERQVFLCFVFFPAGKKQHQSFLLKLVWKVSHQSSAAAVQLSPGLELTSLGFLDLHSFMCRPSHLLLYIYFWGILSEKKDFYWLFYWLGTSTFFASLGERNKLHNAEDIKEHIWNKFTVNKRIIVQNKAALNELPP